jgi:hypothetical protein
VTSRRVTHPSKKSEHAMFKTASWLLMLRNYFENL